MYVKKETVFSKYENKCCGAATLSKFKMAN